MYFYESSVLVGVLPTFSWWSRNDKKFLCIWCIAVCSLNDPCIYRPMDFHVDKRKPKSENKLFRGNDKSRLPFHFPWLHGAIVLIAMEQKEQQQPTYPLFFTNSLQHTLVDSLPPFPKTILFKETICYLFGANAIFVCWKCIVDSWACRCQNVHMTHGKLENNQSFIHCSPISSLHVVLVNDLYSQFRGTHWLQSFFS